MGVIKGVVNAVRESAPHPSSLAASRQCRFTPHVMQPLHATNSAVIAVGAVKTAQLLRLSYSRASTHEAPDVTGKLTTTSQLTGCLRRNGFFPTHYLHVHQVD